MSEERFGWIGPTDGYRPLLRELGGKACSSDDLPEGWTPKCSPGEAATAADFVFVRGDVRATLARGVLNGAAPGASIAMIDADPTEVAALADVLDEAGLDGLDLALLHDPPRFSVGGNRDTFDLLKPALRPIGRPFFCGAIGSGTRAALGEGALLKAPNAERLGMLPKLLDEAEASGAFPQALRNVWKAGPLGGPAFDAEADRLTKR